MELRDAYNIVVKNFKTMIVMECIEYSNLFVFGLRDKQNTNNDLFGGRMWSVNKHTGELKPFLPMDISIDDFRNGRKVKRFW